MTSDGYQYDAFISHAVEDKISIANELFSRLSSEGLKIWYSGNELGIGDSIEESVYCGLQQSRFGIVIFSPNYISKRWAIQEFHAFIFREREGVKIILPISHEISIQEIRNFDPNIVDRFIISSDRGMDVVVEKIVKAIREAPTPPDPNKKTLWISMSILTALIILFSIVWTQKSKPSSQFIRNEISDRIQTLHGEIDVRHLEPMKAAGAKPCSAEIVDSLFKAFRNLKTNYRNEYEFFNGFANIHSKKMWTTLFKPMCLSGLRIICISLCPPISTCSAKRRLLNTHSPILNLLNLPLLMKNGMMIILTLFM